MADLALVDAVRLIFRSVAHVPTSVFLRRCSDLQLEPTQVAEPEVALPGFPQYDASQTFAFKTDDQAPAFFDVLGYHDRIIQIRLTVQHHRALLGLLPSKCDAHVRIVEPLLVGRYGPGRRPGPDTPLMFGDNQTDAYLSRVSAGRSETLFVNVGDREVWRLAGGVVIMG